MKAQIVKFTQALLTFIRGVANEGEEPLFEVSPLLYLAVVLVIFFSSITSAHLIFAYGNIWWYVLLPIVFAIAQAAVWSMYMLTHHAIHGAISRRAMVNASVAEVLSVMILTPSRDRYRKSHGNHHQPERLAMDEDPDYRWLRRWGFLPGRALSYYWKQFWLTLFNPAYYATFFWKRLRANFVNVPFYRQVLALTWWVFVVCVTYFFNAWLILLSYLLVLIVGYGMSSLCQTLSEHRWKYEGSDSAEKTFPRLLPVDDRPKNAGCLNGIIYILLLCFYLYWCNAVLGTDLQQHQIHHLRPRDLNWTMVAYSKAAQEDRSKAIWGIKNHFNEAFRSLSAAPSEEEMNSLN